MRTQVLVCVEECFAELFGDWFWEFVEGADDIVVVDIVGVHENTCRNGNAESEVSSDLVMLTTVHPYIPAAREMEYG